MNEPRESLRWFAEWMEAWLREARGNGEQSVNTMLVLLQATLHRIRDLLSEPEEVATGWQAVVKECAEAAAYAMMIADNARRQNE